jgi:SAM-dependent methyltransferase
VVEHCEDDRRALEELTRVLAPGGRLLLSVPAYQWAWSEHDVRAGHHRRYTRPALERLVEGSGLTVLRSTYAFGAVFPFFLAERALREVRRRTGRRAQQRLTPVSPATDRLLMRLSAVDRRVLRRRALPFGSSVLLAAVKRGPGA